MLPLLTFWTELWLKIFLKLQITSEEEMAIKWTYVESPLEDDVFDISRVISASSDIISSPYAL